jgi:acetyl esterase/lipase
MRQPSSPLLQSPLQLLAGFLLGVFALSSTLTAAPPPPSPAKPTQPPPPNPPPPNPPTPSNSSRSSNPSTPLSTASKNHPPGPSPSTLVIRQDLPYADSQNPRQTLDLYLPSPQPSSPSAPPLPVVVFIHGGGWKAGNKAAGAAHLTRLVQSGQYAGISLAYRLSSEAKWPAQLHDCKAAIRWIKAHASEYGLDPQKIAVWGSSAGGHLASLLGTSGDVPELEGSLGPHLSQNSRIQAVLNFYGPQNFLSLVSQESSVNRSTKDYPEALLLGGRIQDLPELAKAASPITYASAGDPPFLSAQGTNDPLVPPAQAREIHSALLKVGVESYLIEMTDAGHGFRSPELDTRIDRFLAKHLLGKATEIAATAIAKGQ